MTTLPIEEARAGPAAIRLEFVTIIAVMMALTALSIDIMLPALPAISADFGLAFDNERQLVITYYMLGFAAGQLVHGPLSDSFGRKPVVLIGLGTYAAATAVTFVATEYSAFLWARALQGIACAAPRVIAVAVVRDLFAGRHMAKVMSFVIMVFIVVPVLAPSAGDVLLLIGHWRGIFVFLLVTAILIMVLVAWRLPETRPRAQRAPFSPRWIGAAFRQVLRSRQAVGYTVAIGCIFGCMMSYINSAQQILEGIYGLDRLFPIIFGAIALSLALAAIVNSSLVQRAGMRRLSHGALIGFILVALTNAAVALIADPAPPLVAFAGLLALNLFLFGLIMPNFNAIAMEPLGRIAGTGSSFVGFFTTGAGALLALLVGQLFDGTVVPLTMGYLLLSLAALVVVAVTERGRLFGVGGHA